MKTAFSLAIIGTVLLAVGVLADTPAGSGYFGCKDKLEKTIMLMMNSESDAAKKDFPDLERTQTCVELKYATVVLSSGDIFRALQNPKVICKIVTILRGSMTSDQHSLVVFYLKERPELPMIMPAKDFAEEFVCVAPAVRHEFLELENK